MTHSKTTAAGMLAISVLAALATATVAAQDGRRSDPLLVPTADFVRPDAGARWATRSNPARISMRIDPQSQPEQDVADTDLSPFGLVYHEISDFFNVREANANVSQGVWELELELAWETDSAGGDDDVAFTPNLKYGITDDMFIEVEVLPMNLGDGGDQGNGDFTVQLFYQWLHENDGLPAFATWIEARVPSGQGSSGVDAELHFNLTKTFLRAFRGNLEGFVKTANGGRGDEDTDRRAFQWGVGPGVDYQFDAKTIAAANYLLRSNDDVGEPDQNILELGMVRELVPGQHLKLAVDVGLDGHESTPNFEAKLLWSIEWD